MVSTFADSKNKQKVAVGLSGGVDSSVAALLLKEQGYEVVGVYMQCWDVKEEGCAADEDKAYAVQTAAKLSIKFEALDFREDYKKRVIDYFYDEYAKGRTPNPDVMCNKEIKFGIFFEWAMEKGFNYIATGHYARVQAISKSNPVFQLLKGVDEGKDQSYFLYRLGQEQLGKSLFPVGGYKKSEIRKLAGDAALPTYKRPESMGICFIGEVDIKKFLEQRIDHKPGNVLNTKGEVIGEHDGVWFLTIGQRHGFRVRNYYGVPLYVIGKNAEKNELIVGTYEEALCTEFEVEDVSWILQNPFDTADATEVGCEVRIRHLGKMYKATLCKTSATTLTVKLSQPIFGVASGQSAVFYSEDVVLGGGVIQ